MALQQAWELCYGAVGRLATGTGSVHVRLTTAAHELGLINPQDDLPEELREEFAVVTTSLVQVERLSVEEASTLAGRIVALYDAIATDPHLLD
jgi:hypothetical protein